MPLTPFAGLSVVIHLLIILVSTLVDKVFPNTNTFAVPRISKRLTFFVCLCIIVTIFSIVLLNATQMIYSSLNNKYSSVRYLSTVVDSIESNAVFKEGIQGARMKTEAYSAEVQHWWAGTNGASLLLTFTNKYD